MNQMEPSTINYSLVPKTDLAHLFYLKHGTKRSESKWLSEQITTVYLIMG